MTLGIEREGLAEPLRAFHAAGRPIFGTCAGLIMLDRGHLGLMDIVAERNAFGRQLHSFEEDLEFPDMEGGPVRAVFIRAPWISEHGPGVEVLAVGRRAPGGRAPGLAAGDLVPPGAGRRPAAARGVPAGGAGRAVRVRVTRRAVLRLHSRQPNPTPCLPVRRTRARPPGPSPTGGGPHGDPQGQDPRSHQGAGQERPGRSGARRSCPTRSIPSATRACCRSSASSRRTCCRRPAAASGSSGPARVPG